MLKYLVASAPLRSWSAGGALWSAAFHGAVVLAAVRATVGSGTGGSIMATDTTLVFIQPSDEPKPETPPVPELSAPAGFNVLVAPVTIPTGIPPIDLRETFDPRDYTGIGVERPVGALAGFGAPAVEEGGAWAEALVDEKPEILSAPPLVYPDILRQAGIEGSVLVEAIVDTAGRAEPGSLRVIESTHPAFNPPALDVVRRALYRPGRTGGHVVRVLVNVPVNFGIRRRG